MILHLRRRTAALGAAVLTGAATSVAALSYAPPAQASTTQTSTTQTSTTQTSTTQTPSCVDGSGTTWQGKGTWGSTYIDSSGVIRVRMDYAGWTTNRTGALNTVSSVKTYSAGTLSQNLTWTGSQDYTGGTTWHVRNPANPLNAPGVSKVTETLAVGSGSPCTMTFVEPGTAAAPPTPTARPFLTAADWLWNPVPSNPVLDARSGVMAADLATSSHNADIYEFGTPLYVASGSETRYKVPLSMAWGSNDFLTNPAPLTSAYATTAGSDAPLVVRDGNYSYEFWQYAWNSGSPKASWGAVLPLSGNGSAAKAPTGAGISRLAGIVTTAEFTAGQINHALIFSSNNSCGTFRFPASKTDGASSASNCTPEGARIQLDPSVDISALPMKERAVARALQVYGAYCGDNGGAKMAFAFEMPHAGSTDPYAAAGWWDYYDMANISWAHLRVLATSTGQ